MNYPVLAACFGLSLATVLLGRLGWLPPNVVSHVLAVLGGALLPTSALAAKKKPVITTTLAPSAPDDKSDDSGDISPLLKVEVKDTETKS